MSPIVPGENIAKLMVRARRRLLLHGLIAQGVNTCCAGLGALIVLLLIGTGILNGHWLVPIPVGMAAAGIFLARRSVPPPYLIAQLLDRRLHLADTLSTAVYFSCQGAAAGDVRDCQFAQAERLAAQVDVCRALPYRVPRGVYPLAILALVASGLFVLRYGLSRRIDLQPPLARILQQQLGFPPRTVLARNLLPQSEPRFSDSEEFSADPDHGEPATASPNDPSEPQGAQPTPEAAKIPGNSSQKTAGGQQAGSEPGQAEQTENGDNDRSDASPRESARKSGGGERHSGGAESKNDQDSSLLSKMKDALQNLLSRMKPQSQNAASQEQSQLNPGPRQPGRGRENGAKQPSRGSDNDPQGESSAEQSAGAKEAAQSANKGSAKGDSPQSGKQPGSGIGSQDGDKRIKEAEQLAAMGKISEIIGKRSATLTGQATVEVQSTVQQLLTPYATRNTRHVQDGAEIGRDEIPVALESYVEKYFEELRKQAKK